MGSCGAACQRRQYSELSDSRNVLQKQMENEIDQLKNETTKLQRKLKKQTAEISSLQNKLDTLQTNTSNNHNDEEKLTENSPETDEPFAAMSAIRIDEENVTDKRVKDTLRRASDVTDVKKFVLNQYKTDTLSLDEFENDAQGYNDESSGSSLAASEKVAIEQAKLERDKQNEIDEEVAAMHQEMDQMKFDGLQGSDDLEISIDLDGDLPHNNTEITTRKSNLFRNRSEKNWNMARLSQQKKEMTAALAHLVETHVHSVTAAKEENDASSD